MICTKNVTSILGIKPTPKLPRVFFQSKRLKSGQKHWALKNKKTAIDKALEHFDDFYKSVYGNGWRSIRIALLSPHKYCAVVNNFGDIKATSSLLENEGAFNMRKVFVSRAAQISENASELKRKKELDTIFKLDKKLERIAERKKQDELQELYPENDGLPPNTSDGSLDKEEGIDWSRQMDLRSGLSGAALYDFVPANKLKGREDFVSESEHYSYYEKYLQVPVEMIHEKTLKFPEHLQVYSYEMSNMTYFEQPRRGSTGVLNYYLMNASSLLPVLALNLAPGDRFLDMCAAPGGKSIVALQTLYPELVWCNDCSRSDRLKRVLRDYFYDVDKRVKITMRDGRFLNEVDLFNKILVDAPCTNDRHSVIENDNNIFKSDRLKFRFRLPELQADLLSNALKLVTLRGTVVYSTCSLSPIQNDGVVQMALRKIWEETRRKFYIVNMKKALEPSKIFFKLGENTGLKYGHIVLPYLPANFGPLYFCKLIRVE